MRRSLVAFFLLALATCSSAMAIEDTPENRAAQADYYLQIMPPRDLLEDLSEKVAASLPAEFRADYKAMMTKHLDIHAYTQVIRSALVKHFTAEEIKALVDFYRSPLGKSVMSKFGTAMADATPAIQALLVKAVAAAQKEMAAAKK
jgi:hypothetical protein